MKTYNVHTSLKTVTQIKLPTRGMFLFMNFDWMLKTGITPSPGVFVDIDKFDWMIKKKFYWMTKNEQVYVQIQSQILIG